MEDMIGFGLIGLAGVIYSIFKPKPEPAPAPQKPAPRKPMTRRQAANALAIKIYGKPSVVHLDDYTGFIYGYDHMSVNKVDTCERLLMAGLDILLGEGDYHATQYANNQVRVQVLPKNPLVVTGYYDHRDIAELLNCARRNLSRVSRKDRPIAPVDSTGDSELEKLMRAKAVTQAYVDRAKVQSKEADDLLKQVEERHARRYPQNGA